MPQEKIVPKVVLFGRSGILQEVLRRARIASDIFGCAVGTAVSMGADDVGMACLLNSSMVSFKKAPQEVAGVKATE